MISTFSKKQLTVMNWWLPSSRYSRCDAIICDGAVRSGKTLCLSLSFVMWSMHCFNRRDFALCGKTVTSLVRNMVTPLLGHLKEMGVSCDFKVSRSILLIRYKGKENRYYLYGGKDEGSAALIQGVTLAGVLFDEAALMPRSFVQQALARCSVEGSKFWFNCNPQSPHHWFYKEWVRDPKKKNACYLHFTMKDNPTLSPAMLKRYSGLYSGLFYRRYIKGEWVQATGLVYPMFSRENNVIDYVPACTRYIISCDYGTVNPASFGLWGESGGSWVRIREFYYDSRLAGVQKTDDEYADDLETLAGGLPVEAVIIDPSAASFIQCVRRRGSLRAMPARNAVSDGIRTVSAALKNRRILIHKSCADCIREFSLYSWAESGQGGDVPVKENDHAMDDLRYFAAYVFGQEETGGGFFAVAAARSAQD